MVIVRLKGGLGNQMFEYAAGRARALERNDELFLDTTFLNDRTPRRHFTFRSYELGVFRIEEHFTILSRLSSVLPIPLLWPLLSVLVEKWRSFFSEGFRCLDGYFQDEGHFKKFAAELRKDFTFKTAPSPVVEETMKKIREKESVSIHVRRGDYVSDSKTAEVHGFLGLEYYERAVEFISGRTEHPHLFIFSDDLDWCRNHLKMKYPTDYVSCGLDDLQLMSLCEHNIVANSTFSWWGAWLNANPKKIVVAPKMWFAGSNEEGDIIPKNWVRV